MFHRKPKIPNTLHLNATDSFKDCPHFIGTFDYGAHPRRVYAYCAICQKITILNWKDTYGRTMNRIWSTMPAIFSAAMIFITVAFIFYAVSLLH